MKLSTHVTQPHMIASFLMNDIARICRQLVDQQMRPLGLTRAQWYLLNYVFLYDGLSQQELADLIDLGKSNVAKQIHSLEEKGWVRRGPHERDGRSFRVYLTAEMKPTIKKLNKLVELNLQNAFQGLEETKVPQFIDALRNIDRQLENELRSGLPLKGSKKLLDEIASDMKKISAR